MVYFKSTTILLALALGLGTAAAGSQQASQQPAGSALDQQIASYLQQQFSGNEKLSDVHSSVNDRIVTLSGTVPDYRTKLEALKDARQVKSANGLIDNITVGGPAVPDQQLRNQIANRLAYDRAGMGQVFNSLDIGVHNGVITLSGEVHDYASRDSAVDIAADTKGVKGVVDNIKVAPTSMMDDQIRMEAAQRIYGNSSLRRYASDPAHPIRIIVDHGNITLIGVVNSQLDKTLAGNAARSVPGAFKVTNDLMVAQ